MFFFLNTLEKRMTLLFLGFKNYRLRPHGEGFEAVRTFFGQRESWGSIFRDFVRMSFGRPLIHISGNCVQ